MPKLVPILEFAYRIGFTNFYDWQCKILLRYEAGEPTAAACANYTGKTSVIFPICALWTLANFSRSRLPQGGNSRGSRRDWQPVRSCQRRGQADDRALRTFVPWSTPSSIPARHRSGFNASALVGSLAKRL